MTKTTSPTNGASRGRPDRYRYLLLSVVPLEIIPLFLIERSMKFRKPARVNAEKNSVDVLGIAPYGETLKVIAEKSAETAQRFLYDICRPAAAEFGLFLRDNVRAWRARNLADIANKSRELLTVSPDGVQLRAHPRFVAEVVEHGSWCEDEQLQSMWAGLLASACTEDGKDESNLLFGDLLKRITGSEARFLRVVCEKTRKGWGPQVGLSDAEFAEAMGTSSKQVIAYQLGHLRSLGLISLDIPFDQFLGRLTIHEGKDATPTDLGLHLYIRCQGSRKNPEDFFEWNELRQQYGLD
jgi:hypothetical protein